MEEQLNTEPRKGRKATPKRAILFFLFLCLVVVAVLLGMRLKHIKEDDDKQDDLNKEISNPFKNVTDEIKHGYIICPISGEQT